MDGLPTQFIQQDADAEIDRTVWIKLVSGDDYVTPFNTAFSGSSKAKLSFDGGTAADTDNAVAQADRTNHPGLAKVVLSATEVASRGQYVVTYNKGNAFGQTHVVVSEEKPEDMGSSDFSRRHRAGKPT